MLHRCGVGYTHLQHRMMAKGNCNPQWQSIEGFQSMLTALIIISISPLPGMNAAAGCNCQGVVVLAPGIRLDALGVRSC